jgi:hypothetical protein
MSSAVAVDTSASSVGFGGSGVLAGLGLAVIGGVYLAGPSILNLSKATLGLSAIIVGIVLWLLLTDAKKLGSLVADNNLVSLALACVVGLDLVMHAGVVFKYPALAIA